MPTFAKDSKIIKNMMKIIPISQLVELIEIYFEVEDPFILNSGHTVGVFQSQLSKLRQIKAGNINPIKNQRSKIWSFEV